MCMVEYRPITSAGRMNKTDRDGNLPLPCSFMDIHICGACKAQFHNVELFIAHKQQSCPVLVEMRSLSYGQLSTTSTDVAQTTRPPVTIVDSLPLTTRTTTSSIAASSLATNTTTTISNQTVTSSGQMGGSPAGDEAESTDNLPHQLHLPSNAIEGETDHNDQSLSAKLELSFLDVQQVVREDFKNRNNNFKDPFLLSPATNCHSMIGHSRLQNAAHTMSQNILEADEVQSEVSSQIAHNQKPNHIPELTSRPSQTITPEQLMHTLQLTSNTNNPTAEHVLVKSVQQQADITGGTAVAQQFFTDQIITEPLNDLAAIASDTLQSGQQAQLTTNFPLPHCENHQSFSDEASGEIVSSAAPPSSSISVMNRQLSGNNHVDGFQLRMMTGTEPVPVPVPVQVPTVGYMAIVQEFDVSPTPQNSMLTECETLPASPTPPEQQPPPPPPASQLQQQQQQPQTSVVVRDEVSNNLDNDVGGGGVGSANLLQNENNQLQPVLQSTNFISCSQAPTKQSTVTVNVSKVSLKNRQTPNKKFKCTFEVCEFQTAYLKDLERHTRTHTGERPFQCQVCRKSFNRSDKLKIHLRGHTGNKPYRCQICSYSSADSSSLKKHLRIHTNERPFKCQMCSYASRNSSQLIVHLRTHTGDSPFQCQLCDAKFKINSDLKRHVRTHTGEKPFKCDLCDYRCSIKANLKSHYRINHSTEHQLQCDICGFTSSSRKSYKEHIKTHDTDRPIKCPMCAYQCSRKSALLNHLRTHSEERPFRCDFCTYTSKQSSNVKTHLKKKHSDKLRQKKKSASRKSTTEVAEKVAVVTEVVSCPPLSAATSSSIDSINGGQVRIKPNCKKTYNCEQCNASFVRQDSLRSHVRQHQDIEKALQSTAMAVLQLQNPVGPLNQQNSSSGTSGSANQTPSQHIQNSNETSSEPSLGTAVPAIPDTSAIVSKTASNSSSLFSSTSSHNRNPKPSKDNLAFQQSLLNISNVNDIPISNQDHSLLSGLSPQKNILSSLSQPVSIAAIPPNNTSCPPQSAENIQTLINIAQNNPNLISIGSTDPNDNKGIIISQNSIINSSVSDSLETHTINHQQPNLGHLGTQQEPITDSISQTPQCYPGNIVSSPLSVMTTTSQTNVSHVLPSSVTSPGVSAGAQSVVNGFLLNNQPQPGAIVTPQFLQTSTALQLISNISLPFFRMPTTQLGTQTAQILPNQVLGQPQEPISIMSSPLTSTLSPHQHQQTSSEIPIQIISQRNQQQNAIPINVQISQINLDAAANAIRNEILEQCTSGGISASLQVILPPNLQPTAAAIPQVCTMAPASTLDSATASIPTSAGEILVQVSSCPHQTSQSTSCLPMDQSNNSATIPSTASSLTSLSANLIPVNEQTLPTSADASTHWVGPPSQN